MTQARQRLNRASVVEMAAHIADAEGLDAVTLSRIAADAGVKQPALYRHVTGIEELWTLLSLQAREMLVQ
jgi:AcrR family transcriptional regulator